MIRSNEETPTPEVVIVAYGESKPLEECLRALGPGWEPLVVDNSSFPTTRAVVERHGATYLDPGANIGFAAGVNHALRHRRRPHADVLLLNPDATISSAEIDQLSEQLHGEPRLACVAPAQIDPVDGVAGRVFWPFPTPAGAWMEAIGLGSRRTACDFVIGAVLLLRGEAVDQVGWLDERFFLYSEETDWQLRATRAGWSVGLCPEVVATHVGAGTGGDPRRRETHFHASHERFIRKHHGVSGWYIFRAACIAAATVRSVVLPDERRRRARFRLRLYLEGPCRAEGRLRRT